MENSKLVLILLFLTGCSSVPQSNSNHRNSLNMTTTQHAPIPQRYRQELEVVRRGKYKRQRLMNAHEEKVYWKLVNYCNKHKLRVFAQVSLGEILSAEPDYYRYINAKRIDFVLTDKKLMPIAAIEYQGSGHVNHTSEERDAVKRAAVEDADIVYISLKVGSENDVISVLNSRLASYS